MLSLVFKAFFFLIAAAVFFASTWWSEVKEWLAARELTTLVAREAEAMEARLADLRRHWGWLQIEVEPDVDPGDAGFPTASGALAVLDQDGAPIEIAPDPPAIAELSLAAPASRRARLFAQYWVSRVHERFPAVVGTWDKASLASTRLWLCKEMRASRPYTVRRQEENGQVVREVRYRRGMHTHQIAACVDWLVTLAHRGTLAQQAQEKIRQARRPNWIMRLLGYNETSSRW